MLRALGFSVCVLLALLMPAQAQTVGRNFATSQFTVTTTAQLVVPVRMSRLAVTIQTLGAVAIFCGPTAAVTTSTGFRIPATDGASVTIPTSAAVFCLVASGTQAVSVLESF